MIRATHVQGTRLRGMSANRDDRPDFIGPVLPNAVVVEYVVDDIPSAIRLIDIRASAAMAFVDLELRHNPIGSRASARGPDSMGINRQRVAWVEVAVTENDLVIWWNRGRRLIDEFHHLRLIEIRKRTAVGVPAVLHRDADYAPTADIMIERV